MTTTASSMPLTKPFPKGEKRAGNLQNTTRPRIPTKDTIYEGKRRVYESTMDNLSKEIDSLKAKYAELSDKLKATIAGEEGKAQRDAVLQNLQKLRKTRDGLLETRSEIARNLEEALEIARSRTAELDAARDKLPCKRKEDLDAKIADLERQIESGVVLSEEKRIVGEISKLHKARRGFDSISSLISAKDQIDHKIETLRSSQKKIDGELKTLRATIKQENDKYSELVNQKTNTTSIIQDLKKSLEEIRSQIDDRFKQRTAAYEAFAIAKEAHRVWTEERRAKYQVMAARRELEDSLKNLEQELKQLSVNVVPEEIRALEKLESAVSGLLPSKQTDGKQTITKSAKPPRTVEAIDENKYTILEKHEEVYFAGKKNPCPSGKTHPKTTFGTLPSWAILDLELHGIGAINSVSDAENALQHIDTLKKKLFDATRESYNANEDKRTELRGQIEQLKSKLADLS